MGVAADESLSLLVLGGELVSSNSVLSAEEERSFGDELKTASSWSSSNGAEANGEGKSTTPPPPPPNP